jgi:16S rRNA (cytidine1402-2'-O)-methyltransferase
VRVAAKLGSPFQERTRIAFASGRALDDFIGIVDDVRAQYDPSELSSNHGERAAHRRCGSNVYALAGGGGTQRRDVDGSGCRQLFDSLSARRCENAALGASPTRELRAAAMESLLASSKRVTAMPLIIVPTPLGNLGDITLRALDALRDCEVLVAEDSRVARKLLAALGLRGREIVVYHEHNAENVTSSILNKARSQRVALTTDAGTPAISDPGAALIAAARSAGVAIESLPGPTALIGIAVLSGFPLQRFTFEGFPPRSSAKRRRAFERALSAEETSVWYESPKRIRATLADLEAVAEDASLFLVREYTKLHEQQVLGTPREVASALGDVVLGEIAFAIAPRKADRKVCEPAGVDRQIDAMLAAGAPVAKIAKTLAQRGLGERRALYERAAGRKRLHRDGL